MESVDVPWGVLGPPPQPAMTTQASAAAPKLRRKARRLPMAKAIAASRIPRDKIRAGPRKPPGVSRRCERGTRRPCVVIVAVEVAASWPSRVTEGGARVQVESVGAPVQVRSIVCVEKSMGVTVTVNVTVLPSPTDSDVGAVMVKSRMPVPVTGITCGLLGSPSKKVRLAEAAPRTVGVKLMLTLQPVPGAR